MIESTELPAGLIGGTGYVGSSLARQRRFDLSYRSTDINAIRGLEFDLLVCAGAPGQKWLANAAPDADLASISTLIDTLESVSARRFVLISTVDVFGVPTQVDEATRPGGPGITKYGTHRLLLEEFVREHFDALVVRLPGLVGPGLRKNVVFDFAHGHDIDKIDSRAEYQFYPVVNLSSDVEQALGLGLDTVHLAAAPISVAELARDAFGREFSNVLPGTPARYDFRSRHAADLGGTGCYQYSQRESLLAIRSYAQGVSA